jgi:hypothetical protein
VNGAGIRSRPSPVNDRTVYFPVVPLMASFASKVDAFPDFQPTARKVTCHEPASTRRPTKIRSAPRSVDDIRGEGGSSFGGEQAALRAYYGAKIEATRRSRPRDLAAALRTLFIEQRSALLELARRRRALKISAKEYRRAENFSRREEERRARPS